MPNPWLEIPLADYTGHMGSPAVGQTRLLNELLAAALRDLRPRTVLHVGCGAGNGLEHVDPAVTERVVGVDVNPNFLAELHRRLPQPGFELETRCGDIGAMDFAAGSFALAHAALVFEYVDWRAMLPRLSAALAPGGVLSVVLQLPCSTMPAVTPTPFRSLYQLESIFHFVDPEALAAQAAACGLPTVQRRVVQLPSGKEFAVLRCSR